MSERSEYYKVRLEHTIQHTQQSARLIYLINGAVLAMLYFILEKFSDDSARRYSVVFLLILLAVLNSLHAKLIRIQGSWYGKLDSAYAETVSVIRISGDDLGIKRNPGTHGIYRWIHIVIATMCFFLAIAVYFFLPNPGPGLY